MAAIHLSVLCKNSEFEGRFNHVLGLKNLFLVRSGRILGVAIVRAGLGNIGLTLSFKKWCPTGAKTMRNTPAVLKFGFAINQKFAKLKLMLLSFWKLGLIMYWFYAWYYRRLTSIIMVVWAWSYVPLQTVFSFSIPARLPRNIHTCLQATYNMFKLATKIWCQ